MTAGSTARAIAHALAESPLGTSVTLTYDNIDAFRLAARQFRLPVVARFDKANRNYRAEKVRST